MRKGSLAATAMTCPRRLTSTELLFEDDPDERHDLGEDPSLSELRQRLGARLLEGWDPIRIREEVDLRCTEKALLRRWGQQTQPPSLVQFPITAEDSWLEKPA
ncbi:MAG: hypothetical protein KDK08_07080 [Rhizobiaceae bacterium]|nr:hypothetical protein [Rhizobiaceae bacterium]